MFEMWHGLQNETFLKANMHATNVEDLRKYFVKDALEMIVHDVG